MKPGAIPSAQKWCPDCATLRPLDAFGPDKSRPPLYVRGKCKACSAGAKSKAAQAGRGLHLTAEQHAERMIQEAVAYADDHDIPFGITSDTLLPMPPVCPVTLDNLLEGTDAQVPVLALLCPGRGFTIKNTVIVSARARRRHQVLGPRALRANLGRPSDLGRMAVAVVVEAVARFNSMCWDAEVLDIAAEIASLEIDTRGHLCVAPRGRKAKATFDDAKAESLRNWCGLVSDEAEMEYAAAGYRQPPSIPANPLSMNLRFTRSPAEWQEWLEEQPKSQGPWRIPGTEGATAPCPCVFCPRG